jgi:hypothetical protein
MGQHLRPMAIRENFFALEKTLETALDRFLRFSYLPATTRATAQRSGCLRRTQHTSVSTRGWVCLGHSPASACGPAKRQRRQGCGPHASITGVERNHSVRVRGAFPAIARLRERNEFRFTTWRGTQGGESADGRRAKLHGPVEITRERPIAPGKGWCPLPPWDPTFPGAFFCAPRRRRSRLDANPASLVGCEMRYLANLAKRVRIFGICRLFLRRNACRVR